MPLLVITSQHAYIENTQVQCTCVTVHTHVGSQAARRPQSCQRASIYMLQGVITGEQGPDKTIECLLQNGKRSGELHYYTLPVDEGAEDAVDGDCRRV